MLNSTRNTIKIKAMEYNFENCNLDERISEIVDIIKTTEQQSPNINLEGTYVSFANAAILAEAIKKPSKFITLMNLDLTFTAMDDKSVSLFTQALMEVPVPTILNLGYNSQISDMSALMISSSIARSDIFTKIGLYSNFKITDTGIRHLADGIRRASSAVNLDLSGINIGILGFKHLALSLIKTSVGVGLDLVSVGMNDEKLEYVVSALAKGSRSISICLDDNKYLENPSIINSIKIATAPRFFSFESWSNSEGNLYDSIVSAVTKTSIPVEIDFIKEGFYGGHFTELANENFAIHAGTYPEAFLEKINKHASFSGLSLFTVQPLLPKDIVSVLREYIYPEELAWMNMRALSASGVAVDNKYYTVNYALIKDVTWNYHSDNKNYMFSHIGEYFKQADQKLAELLAPWFGLSKTAKLYALIDHYKLDIEPHEYLTDKQLYLRIALKTHPDKTGKSPDIFMEADEIYKASDPDLYAEFNSAISSYINQCNLYLKGINLAINSARIIMLEDFSFKSGMQLVKDSTFIWSVTGGKAKHFEVMLSASVVDAVYSIYYYGNYMKIAENTFVMATTILAYGVLEFFVPTIASGAQILLLGYCAYDVISNGVDLYNEYAFDRELSYETIQGNDTVQHENMQFFLQNESVCNLSDNIDLMGCEYGF